MQILQFPPQAKSGRKTVFKANVYRIVHSPAGMIRKR